VHGTLRAPILVFQTGNVRLVKVAKCNFKELEASNAAFGAVFGAARAEKGVAGRCVAFSIVKSDGARAANDAPNVPATLWSDDNKRLDVGDITLAQAITWDQQDLDTGARKNDDVQFVNAKLGYGFSPLMSRAKLSEEREFSLLFALNGAGCDKQLGDEQLKFASLKCSKAATTKASGIFVSLKKRDKQAPDDPSIYLLQFLADYLLSGETESDPPRNATR